MLKWSSGDYRIMRDCAGQYSIMQKHTRFSRTISVYPGKKKRYRLVKIYDFNFLLDFDVFVLYTEDKSQLEIILLLSANIF
jgi:hypothetical protein